MSVLPARKGGGDAAPKARSGGPSWGPRLALAVFVVLFALGLALLFAPDLATELEERTGGGGESDETAAATVTVTEAKRTTEARSRARTASDRPANGGSERGDVRGTRRQSTRSTTETTTTTTDHAAPEEGVVEEAFGVPAVVVAARTAVVALLSALVAWAFLRLLRVAFPAPFTPAAGESASSEPQPEHTDPGSQPETPNPGSPPPTQANPESARAEPPRSSPITEDEVEAARASVVEGIPLLREVFAARGEPSVDDVLPDMRVGVRLTETLSKEQPLPVSLFARDAVLGLAAFRTELEQRLRRLARDEDLQCAPSVDAILRNLTEEGLFEPRASEGFRALLRIAQRALHGGSVDPALAGWVTDRGVPLLLSLDLMLPS